MPAIDLRKDWGSLSVDDLRIAEIELLRRTASRVDIDKALADYWEFAKHVQTIYEDPVSGDLTFKPYPVGYDFLRDYHQAYTDAYQAKKDFVCVKGRRLLATYDVLVDWLWRSFVHAMKDSPLFTLSVVRQSKEDAELLVERVQAMYDLLPAPIQAPVTKRLTDEFRIGNSVLRALHAKGTAGRGEPWNRTLFDEHAYQERGETNWNSFAVSRQRMSISTPNGDNHFKVLAERKSARVMVYDLGWEKHPERDEKWAAEERERLGEKVFLVEHQRRFDVYAEPGIFSADFHEDCVVDKVPGAGRFNWDGTSKIIVSIDPGKVDGAGAMIRYFNDNLQDVRLASFHREGMDTDEFVKMVCDYAKARWPDAEWLLTGDPAAEQERTLKTRYNEHQDKQVIERVASQILAGCEYDDQGDLAKGEPIPFQVWNIPRGQGSRKARHALVRAGFRKRKDGLRGTMVVRSENAEWLKGARGAYKLPRNASAQDKEFERPDRSMPCVHVMDADNCGLAQFLRFPGVPTVQQVVKVSKEPEFNQGSVPALAAHMEERWGGGNG